MTRKKPGENREKKPAICLPFPVMNGWVSQVILPCYPGKDSLRNFAGIAGIFRRFDYFGMGFKLSVIVTVCKMYRTKTGVIENREMPQTSQKQPLPYKNPLQAGTGAGGRFAAQVIFTSRAFRRPP